MKKIEKNVLTGLIAGTLVFGTMGFVLTENPTYAMAETDVTFYLEDSLSYATLRTELGISGLTNYPTFTISRNGSSQTLSRNGSIALEDGEYVVTYTVSRKNYEKTMKITNLTFDQPDNGSIALKNGVLTITPDAGYYVSEVTVNDVTYTEFDYVTNARGVVKYEVEGMPSVTATIESELVSSGNTVVPYYPMTQDAKSAVFNAVFDADASALTLDDVTITYQAGMFAQNAPLNKTPGFGEHAFGTQASENVTISYTAPVGGKYTSVSKTVTVTFNDDRAVTYVEFDSEVYAKYGMTLDEVMWQIEKHTNVYTYVEEEKVSVPFTMEDLKISKFMPTDLLEVGEYEVTISYLGNETYQDAKGKMLFYVARDTTPIDISVENRNLKVGEKPQINVVCKDVDYIYLVVGIEGDAQGFASAYLSESIKKTMTEFVYNILVSSLKNGMGFTDAINLLDKTVFPLLVNGTLPSDPRFPMTQEAVNMIDKIVKKAEKILPYGGTAYINKLPTDAGVYMVLALVVDSNYFTTADLDYFTIAYNQGAEVSFDHEIVGSVIGDFDFGVTASVNGAVIKESGTRTNSVFAGLTANGDFYLSKEVPTQKGRYTQIGYVSGNYLNANARTFTIVDDVDDLSSLNREIASGVLNNLENKITETIENAKEQIPVKIEDVKETITTKSEEVKEIVVPKIEKIKESVTNTIKDVSSFVKSYKRMPLFKSLLEK